MSVSNLEFQMYILLHGINALTILLKLFVSSSSQHVRAEKNLQQRPFFWVQEEPCEIPHCFLGRSRLLQDMPNLVELQQSNDAVKALGGWKVGNGGP